MSIATLVRRMFAAKPRTHRNPKPAARRTRLSLDHLEARDVPAFLDAGVLMIVGTDATDNVLVTETIPASWYELPKVQVVHNGFTQTFSKSLIRSSQVVFRGNGGHDTFENRAYLYVNADGGTGRDTLSGGPMNDILIGGTNNDNLYGNGGIDQLFGGQGNDEMRGGTGTDTLTGDGDNDTMRGGPGDDTLYGNDGHDTMYGDNNAGTYGGVGNDVLYGGAGTDILTGEDGGDRLYGEAGFDTLRGNNGNDALFGGTETDRLEGGKGMDGLFGGANDTWDYLNGGADSDRFLMPATSFDGGASYFHEDVSEDFSDEDARPILLNGYAVTVTHSPTETVNYTAQDWTDAEVERTDEVLALLHREARGPRLLETPLGGDLVIVRHGNADRGYNDGRLHMTSANNQYGGNDTNLRGYLLHEVAHAWQGDAFSSGGTNYWGQFVGLSGWTSAYPDDPAYELSTNENRLNEYGFIDFRWYLNNGKYASKYAKTNEVEDFAESFAAYFTMRAGWTFYNNQPGAAAIPEKMALFASWVAEL